MSKYYVPIENIPLVERGHKIGDSKLEVTIDVAPEGYPSGYFTFRLLKTICQKKYPEWSPLRITSIETTITYNPLNLEEGVAVKNIDVGDPAMVGNFPYELNISGPKENSKISEKEPTLSGTGALCLSDLVRILEEIKDPLTAGLKQEKAPDIGFKALLRYLSAVAQNKSRIFENFLTPTPPKVLI